MRPFQGLEVKKPNDRSVRKMRCSAVLISKASTVSSAPVVVVELILVGVVDAAIMPALVLAHRLCRNYLPELRATSAAAALVGTFSADVPNTLTTILLTIAVIFIAIAFEIRKIFLEACLDGWMLSVGV